MRFSPTLPIDIRGNIRNKILALAEKVCIQSAILTGGHTPQTMGAIRELLRITNSYYSNRIESEGTHPIEIEKAMKKEFSITSKEKDLQMLSIAHMDVQRTIEEYCKNPISEVITKSYILKLHKEFYSKDGMEEFLTLDDGTIMTPGLLRHRDVVIHNYVAPIHAEIESMMNVYETEYNRIGSTSTKAMMLINAISAHHRLVWIHPFLDGNGRISRLFMDAMFYKMGLKGYGLWNISRGLARDTKGYKECLKRADMIRQGSKDGRGNLSLMTLEEYVIFMLNVSLEQIEYMNKSLNLATISSRMIAFIKYSQQGMYNTPALPKHSEALLLRLLTVGEVSRGEVKEIIGTQKTVATQLIKTLSQMGYIESDTPKGAIRIKFNAYFASKLMPELMPEQ